jgi:multiple sugar transport system ATP-binding protein
MVVGVFKERLKFRPGEKIVLRPNPGSVHLFDPASGAKI